MHLTDQQGHDPEPNRPAPAHLSGRVVVLVSGLPGVGKSVLVDALAPRLGAAVASRDAARIGSTPGGPRGLTEAIAWRFAHRRLASAQRRAGLILEATVAQHLDAGRSVVVEAVAEPALRQRLRVVALDHDAGFVQLECVLSNRAEHYRRLGLRTEGERFWRTVVASIESGYQVPAECLSLDTSATPNEVADWALSLILSAR